MKRWQAFDVNVARRARALRKAQKPASPYQRQQQGAGRRGQPALRACSLISRGCGARFGRTARPLGPFPSRTAARSAAALRSRERRRAVTNAATPHSFRFLRRTAHRAAFLARRCAAASPRAAPPHENSTKAANTLSHHQSTAPAATLHSARATRRSGHGPAPCPPTCRPRRSAPGTPRPRYTAGPVLSGLRRQPAAMNDAEVSRQITQARAACCKPWPLAAPRRPA